MDVDCPLGHMSGGAHPFQSRVLRNSKRSEHFYSVDVSEDGHSVPALWLRPLSGRQLPRARVSHAQEGRGETCLAGEGPRRQSCKRCSCSPSGGLGESAPDMPLVSGREIEFR